MPNKLFAPRSIAPFLITLASLVIWTFTCNPPSLGYVAFAAGALFVLGILYFVVQFVGRLACHQWTGAVFALLRLALCLLAIVSAFIIAVYSFGMDFGDDTDHFADHLTIPTNIEISKPLPQDTQAPRGADDPFQQEVLASLQRPAGKTASLVPSIPSLRLMATNQRPLLLRYLETSPAWRVYKERGVLYATRRWEFGTRWIWSLNGFYTPMEPYPFATDNPTKINFQTKTTLDLDGKPWMPTRNASWMDEGTSSHPVSLTPDNEMDSSISLIRCGGNAVLEIFDQSPGPGRRLTEAAMARLETECKAMLDRKEFDPSLLPTGSIQHRQPSLNLYEGMEPGIYDVDVRVNPGEEGTVYLKAYEITHNTPLSSDPLKESSNERIGWSSDPQELFLSATNITIYEGDWGHPYAARFELWFQPDSGQPERKLLSRNFIIEGWQR